MSRCDVVEQVARCFRDDGGRTVAALSRLFRDIDLAEDALQEAYVTALERWPMDGFPARPSAWIFMTARNKALNRLRRERTGREKTNLSATLDNALLTNESTENEEMVAVPDDRLAMIFATCHPALSLDSRIALTLRTFAGLTTEEIADAFLVPHATMAQRLVRVKRKIRESRIPFEVPSPERLHERIVDVCTVLYLIFNEGYTASSGDSLVRRELCDEAIRLCSVLQRLMPADPEVMGLLALMLYSNSRRDARLSEDGELVLLSEQDRSRWNQEQIRKADELLRATPRHDVAGPYQLQAWIARIHAHAPTTDNVDWPEVVRLYDELQLLYPSPVIALNRAVAMGFAFGPVAALTILDTLLDSELSEYYLLHLARADSLKRLSRIAEAAAAYKTALQLTRNTAEQQHLRDLIGSLPQQ